MSTMQIVQFYNLYRILEMDNMIFETEFTKSKN